MTRTLRETGRGPFVLFCDHATNFVPPQFHNLGLAEADLARHIAYDTGAAGITEALSEMFDSPAVLSGVSRLVIDCNRHLDAAGLIPEISDGTVIPGNQGLSAEERFARIEQYFQTYHEAIEAVLADRPSAITLSVHSMTARLATEKRDRPWQIALSSYQDRTLADPLIAALQARGDVVVGDNEPYDLDPAVDYSTPYHAFRRGLRHLQVEFRQDLIGTESDQRAWAQRLAEALRAAFHLGG